MKPPCEVVVKQVLPTIRAMVVKDLVERHGLNQVEAAKRLGITQPAVSQYLSSLRGTPRVEKMLREKDVRKEVQEFSDALARERTNQGALVKKYCSICKTLGRKRLLCILHAEAAPLLKTEECNLCLR
jgi:predicted transcriptional regulator